MPGYEWDTWNRKMRRILVDTQCKTTGQLRQRELGPGEGHMGHGRRPADDDVALACLTLEIYYRYLPLFKVDQEVGKGGGGGGNAKKDVGDAMRDAAGGAAKPQAEQPPAEKPKEEKEEK